MKPITQEIACESCHAVHEFELQFEEYPADCPNCEATVWIPRHRWGHLRSRLLPISAAVVLLIVTVVLLPLAVDYFTGLRRQWRADSAHEAYEAGEFAVARDGYLELSESRGLNSEELLRLALSQSKLGERQACREGMQRLIAISADNRSVAHLWLAGDLLAEEPPRLSEARRHLDRVLDAAPEDQRAHRLLLLIKLSLGQYEEAVENYEALAESGVAGRMALAAAYRRTGEPGRAEMHARQALDALMKQDDESPTVEPWKVALFLEDDPLAEQLLRWELKEQGIAALKPRQGLAAVLRKRIERTSEDNRKSPQALGLLLAIQELNPDDTLAYIQLRRLAAGKTPAAAKARQRLQVALARGQQPATVQAMLGDLANREGRRDEAIRHWNQALVSAPSGSLRAILLNNVASEMTWGPDSELPRALKYVEQAMHEGPDHAIFHETRGQILARLGRIDESIAELTSVADSFPNNARLHATLAELYEASRLDDLARRHARRVAQLAPQAKFQPMLPQD